MAGPESETIAAEPDLALLRAYEPIIRYTQGELFLPTGVGPYVERCGLWAGGRGERAKLLVAPGELTLGRVCEESRWHRDRHLFLRFVERPLGRAEYLRWRRIPRARTSHLARFTTTGMVGRIIDAPLRGSLLLRGKVPSGVAAAAETAYREHLDSTRLTYYGRVVRSGGYVCLQYWFFYAMNDWRSTFGGINDHEADWEMVSVYLAENENGSAVPMWVAFSSHDYSGDDLRRRWDDPELRRDGDHPVVFAGAGSHSGAFLPGDYVVTVDPPRIRRIMQALRRMQRLLAPWRHYTGSSPGVGIPFIDYARGDGRAIGPGQGEQWSPVLVDDDTPWIHDFRGLWGLDTGDRFGGERAPSGPRYERDGSVRQAWANPLGWAGLLKISPHDDDECAALARRVEVLDRQIAELDAATAVDRDGLRSLRAEARSLRGHDHLHEVAGVREGEVAAREAALNHSIAARTRLEEERRAHVMTMTTSLAPERPQAHIRRAHRPYSPAQERRTRFLRLWSALSTPLLLGSAIVALLASPLALVSTVAALLLLFSAVEAIARRRLLSFLASLLLVTASVALLLGLIALFLTHWRTAISLLIGIAALALLIANLQDLLRR